MKCILEQLVLARKLVLSCIGHELESQAPRGIQKPFFVKHSRRYHSPLESKVKEKKKPKHVADGD